MVVDGKLERVGDWNITLDDYATKSEVAAISTRVDDIASQLNGVNSTLSTQATSIANISTSVENLTSQLGSVNGSIEDLASQLNATKATVAEHTSQIADLELLLENKVDVSVYNTKMAMVDSDIEELKNAMTWVELKEQ
jgi:chromosome segregation ATPase